ncbi:hypothetical protein AHAS_Ahas20G0254400 [Arachis hypogaea]
MVENQEHRLVVPIGNQGLICTVESQGDLLNVLKENWKKDKQLCTITLESDGQERLEGTASDSKVLKSALSRDDRLKIPRDPDQHLISQVDQELQNNNPEATNEEREEVNEDYKRGAALRDSMAAQMRADYQMGR